MATRKRTPRFRSTKGNGRGRGAQVVRARTRASIGIRMNSIGEEVEGRMGSLVNSFSPSANGWSRPKGPTMLGPLRDCM